MKFRLKESSDSLWEPSTKAVSAKSWLNVQWIMKLILLNWAKFAFCLWTGKNKVAQSAQKPVAEFLTEVYQLLLWGEEKKLMLFCMRVFLRQSQCDGQCGDPGWADGDRICRFLQEGETSAQRGHGATRWGKKQLTVLMIKKRLWLPSKHLNNVKRLTEVC